MELQTLIDFANKQHVRISSKYSDHIANNDEMVLAQVAKLGEEFGELCNEVLSSRGLQRADKLEHYRTSELEGELADVILTALVLSCSLGIDAHHALEQKIEELNVRDRLAS